MTSSSSAESIFFVALGKTSPTERAAYLDEACGDDADLRRQVERLLEAQPQVGSFLEQPLAAGGTGGSGRRGIPARHPPQPQGRGEQRRHPGQ
jgi:hypothetical protein